MSSLDTFKLKKKFTYEDISLLLLASIANRGTWSLTNLHKASVKIWETYKDRLETNHKIILREALRTLYKEFQIALTEKNTIWISNDHLTNIFNDKVLPSIMKPSKRKSIIDSYQPNEENSNAI